MHWSFRVLCLAVNGFFCMMLVIKEWFWHVGWSGWRAWHSSFWEEICGVQFRRQEAGCREPEALHLWWKCFRLHGVASRREWGQVQHTFCQGQGWGDWSRRHWGHVQGGELLPTFVAWFAPSYLPVNGTSIFIASYKRCSKAPWWKECQISNWQELLFKLKRLLLHDWLYWIPTHLGSEQHLVHASDRSSCHNGMTHWYLASVVCIVIFPKFAPTFFSLLGSSPQLNLWWPCLNKTLKVLMLAVLYCGCEMTSLQAHEAIRSDPSFEKKERKAPSEKKTWKPKKLTYDERKASLKVVFF